MNKWGRLWAIWAIIAFGGFLAIETAALLASGPDDTLTEYIAAYVPDEVFFLTFGGFIVWFGYHMIKWYGKRKQRRASR